ncbi:UNVERIFIED_ORG: hypothetical protein BDU10_2530 [Burkholderia sp. CF145]
MSDAASTGRDRVVLVQSTPRPSASEPEPFIVGNGRQVAVAFRIEQLEAGEYGVPFGGDAPFCALLFPHPSSHAYTKEDASAHPLATNGLVADCLQEVLNSNAIVQSSGGEPAVASERQFSIDFSESTFECIAEDCVVAGVYGSDDVAAREAFLLCQ